MERSSLSRRGTAHAPLVAPILGRGPGRHDDGVDVARPVVHNGRQVGLDTGRDIFLAALQVFATFCPASKSTPGIASKGSEQRYPDGRCQTVKDRRSYAG